MVDIGKPIVIKIGGSTLGNHDTTLEDLVTLQKRGVNTVVVHGGAKEINQWLSQLNVKSEFINGLRVTDLQTLKVVTAVLAGVVNKELVADIISMGGKAVGFSGNDGKMILAKNKSPELGYTGEDLSVNPELLKLMLQNGYIPVVAPVCFGLYDDENHKINLINVNGDTAAAEIAASLEAEKLIFLTDVPGLFDEQKKVIPNLDTKTARKMINDGVIKGGMTAKINACMDAVAKVSVTRIIDGREPHALINEFDGKNILRGTTIGR
jgi:acetylglutamate kinase